MPADLYTEILHLPPDPRPLNYYELLALPLFEADREVIHAAVLRQTKELKRWALHPDPATMLRIQEMLNEVNRAGFELEDPTRRADYERQLAERLGIPLPQRGVPPTPALGTVGSPDRASGREAVEDTVGQANRGTAGVVTVGTIREPSPPSHVQWERAEATPQSDSAAGLRPGRSRALIAALAIGIPLAAAALLWVGFFLGRRSPSGERDFAAQGLANVVEAQAAAEARAGQLGEELKKAQAQAVVEAKARAAREAELEKVALAAERRAETLEGALKSREAELEKLILTHGPAKQPEPVKEPVREPPKEPPKAPPAKTPATPVAWAQRGPFEVYTGWPFDAAEAKRRQEETSRALGVPVEEPVDLGGGVKMTFVLIPAGEFLMGDTQGRDDEKPAHKVTLTKPFFLGKHEVTQEQWLALTALNPSRFKGAQNPVDSVLRGDYQPFFRSFNRAFPGRDVRLPTEAEWEYACRAGSASRFSFGDADAGLDQHAWYSGNSNQQTHPVGQKRPNAWGLCDMHGNVWEWCSDWFAPYPAAEQRDPSGPPIGPFWVARGGCWYDDPANCRSAVRVRYTGHDPRHQDYGFRVVLVPTPGVGAPEEAGAAKATAAASTKPSEPPVVTTLAPPRPTSEPPPHLPGAGRLPVYTRWSFDAAEAKRRQEETARALGVPVEDELDLGGGVTMAFVLIPAGEFLMGEDRGNADEKPVHKVTLTKPFFLGKHEVTQEQWQALMGRNPSLFNGAKNPVERVSWDDCQSFVRKLNGKFPAMKFRLPTEAEWEYACRAGSTSHFSFGDADAGLPQHAWYGENSNQQTHPVGEKKPNAWGLCDMHGNVWEWCADWYAPYPVAKQRNPSGPPDGQRRVLRGGCYYFEPTLCRSAARLRNFPDSQNGGDGLRVVFVPGP